MRQKRCCCFCFFFFFFRNGVESRRTSFFFLPRGQQRRWKKNYSSSYEGKIEGLSQRLCSSPVPPRGHGIGSIPERTDSPFCRMPAPSGSPASCGRVDPEDPAGMLAARAPGHLSRAPSGARARRSLFTPLGLGAPHHRGQLWAGMASQVCPSELAQDAQLFFSVARLRLACWILRFCMRSDYSCICI